MAKFELKLPKMGESVAEATITSWLKDVGDGAIAIFYTATEAVLCSIEIISKICL